MTGWGPTPIPSRLLVGLAAATMAAAVLAGIPRGAPAGGLEHRKHRAAAIMAGGMRAVSEARLTSRGGFTPDDAAGTGLVGLRDSPITTSVGILAAKRTTLNPNWAAVMVELLDEAGVRPGDVAAAGFSGSFPALNLAMVAAAAALEVRILVITAAGASNWGANDPEFTWLDMEGPLRAAGIEVRSLAASIGGVQDAGEDLPADSVRLIKLAMARAGVLPIEEATLEASVDRRARLYETAAAGRPIRAFVSIGGAQANLGRCDEMFFLAPGVHRVLPRCPGPSRGTAHRFSDLGVPVISVLNVRSLALRYGLPLTPHPIPAPGEGGIFARQSGALAVILLAAVVIVQGAAVRAARNRRGHFL